MPYWDHKKSSRKAAFFVAPRGVYSLGRVLPKPLRSLRSLEPRNLLFLLVEDDDDYGAED